MDTKERTGLSHLVEIHIDGVGHYCLTIDNGTVSLYDHGRELDSDNPDKELAPISEIQLTERLSSEGFSGRSVGVTVPLQGEPYVQFV